jgi:phage shock protein PspC (stress-responsive transcriptional regulator)
MTSLPPDSPVTPPAGGPRVTRDDVRNLDRLRRTSGPDKYIAGVAGGVARHLDIDPAIVRVLFVVLTFFGGTGLLLYGALWLLLPGEDGDQAIINLDSRSLMFALMAVLVFAAVLLVGDSWGGFGFPWPLTIAGLVVAVILLSRDRRNRPVPPPVAYGPYTPYTPAVPGAEPSAESAAQVAAPPTAEGDVTTEYPAYPAYPGYSGYSGYSGPPSGPWQPSPTPARPVNPRKRGPILFWMTLALAALGGGILGLLDTSGFDVPGSAYPALLLAIVGLMLVVGAFFGRAGGLIFVGLMLAAATAIATVGERYDTDVLRETPASAALVQDSYDFGAGELVIDLTQVRDPENLDGRDILVTGDFGRIEVLVPDDVDVDAQGTIDGPGDVSLFGNHRDGFDFSLSHYENVRDEVATLDIETELTLGEIVITNDEGSLR